MDEYALQITPEAEADIDETEVYIAYHLENPQAAFNLTDGIYAAISFSTFDFTFSAGPVCSYAALSQQGEDLKIRTPDPKRGVFHLRSNRIFW